GGDDPDLALVGSDEPVDLVRAPGGAGEREQPKGEQAQCHGATSVAQSTVGVNYFAGGGAGSGADGGVSFLRSNCGSSSRFGCITISMRRFCRRPTASSLGATGRVSA